MHAEKQLATLVSLNSLLDKPALVYTYACFTSTKAAKQAVTAICTIYPMYVQLQIVMQANAVLLLCLVTHCKWLPRPFYQLCTSMGGPYCLLYHFRIDVAFIRHVLGSCVG